MGGWNSSNKYAKFNHPSKGQRGKPPSLQRQRPHGSQGERLKMAKTGRKSEDVAGGRADIQELNRVLQHLHIHSCLSIT